MIYNLKYMVFPWDSTGSASVFHLLFKIIVAIIGVKVAHSN